MDFLETRLAYQREKGVLLDTINSMTVNVNKDVKEYITWLETRDEKHTKQEHDTDKP